MFVSPAERCEAVIVATGGRTARGLLPEGFEATEPRPVLGPLRTDSRLVKALNNIRVRCAISLMSPDGDAKAREEGEVLFRDYGVSVFNLSRFAEAGDMLRIDLLPRMDAPMLEQLLLERRSRLFARAGSCTGDDVLRGMVLPAVGRGVLKAAGKEYTLERGKHIVVRRRPVCAPKGRSGSAMPHRSRQRSKDSRSRSEASASRDSARCGAADSR